MQAPLNSSFLNKLYG